MRPLIFIASCLLFGVGLLAFDGQRRDQLATDKEPLPRLHQAILDRPRELIQRRFCIAPLCYADSEGKLVAYGLDLPEPGYEQCWLDQPSAAYPTGTKKLQVVRLDDRYCWGLLLWHESWNLLPPHGSVVVKTVPAIVDVR